MSCPEENVIVDFLRGELPSEERSLVEAHVDGCDACRTMLAELAKIYDGTSGAVRAAGAETTAGAFTPSRTTVHPENRKTAGPLLAEGTRLGRYEVRHRLGAGGMGAVYAAYDPELDRLVAIKILRDDLGKDTTTTRTAEARVRLLREAQAMAKLRHPNVIAVHDVGLHDGRVFIAMEFIEGQTLKAWMAAARRGWREILDVFVPAGRGLAAAHHAGLIHRDFKPENVMLDGDGHVRVMDFGLARAVDTAALPAPETTEQQTISGNLSAVLTRTGALVGTPAYMAPEQHLGRATDERTDQFSFCVSLFEALYGARPFQGENVTALSVAVIEGRVEMPTDERGIPKWLRRAVLKGLSSAPEDRYASMQDLLAALSHQPTRLRRRWVAVGALGLMAGGTIAGLQLGTAAREDPCGGGDARVAKAWDATRRETIRRQFESTGVTFANETWERVEPRIEKFTVAWVAMQREACEATHRGLQSTEMLDRRMACLDERLERLTALVELLQRADAEIIEHAVESTLFLDTLDRCADTEALLAEVPPPEDPTTAREVKALRSELTRVEALESSGNYAGALESIEPLLTRALAIDYPPVQAMLRLRKGVLQERLGKFTGAGELIEEAYWQAAGVKDEHTAALAAAWMLYVVAHDLGRLEDGKLWERLGDAAVKRVGAGGEEEIEFLSRMGAVAVARGEFEVALAHHQKALALELETGDESSTAAAIIMQNVGAVLIKLGRYDEALAMQEKARDALIGTLGPNHPKVAKAIVNIGAACYQLGRLDDAGRHYLSALQIIESSLGHEHTQLADLLHNLSLVERRQGDLESALARAERAREIYLETHGPEHVRVAVSLESVGNILYSQGKTAEARERFERALAIRTKASPDNPGVATSHTNIGNSYYLEGDLELARQHYEKALAVRERALSQDHPEVASALFNLAGVLGELGENQPAREAYARCLEIRRKALPPTHPTIPRTLIGLGNVLTQMNRPGEAIAHIEEAITLMGTEADPSSRSEARFALARALWQTGRENARRRALDLAREVMVEIDETGDPAMSRAREQFAEWLTERER